MEAVTLSYFSGRVKHSGVKDEWIVWLRLAGGNHAAAYMLRACVKWGSRKSEGWFYKSDEDWREELDLRRGKLDGAKKVLKLVGVIETEIRRVETSVRYVMGKAVTHYRVNVTAFVKALDDVLAALTGKRIDAPEESHDDQPVQEISIEGCNFFTSTDAENLHQPMQESDIDQCKESAPIDVKESHPKESGSLISDSLIRYINQSHLAVGAREIANLDFPKWNFAGFNDQTQQQLTAYYHALGAKAFDEVVARCSKAAAAHWSYVLTALGNEITRLASVVDAPSPLPPSPTESDVVPAQDFETRMGEFFKAEEAKPDATPEQIRVFQTAWQQLELQLDRSSFDLYARGAKLVSVSADGRDWQISVQHPAAVGMLQHRLYRMVHRLILDAGAENATLQFVARMSVMMDATTANATSMPMMIGAG